MSLHAFFIIKQHFFSISLSVACFQINSEIYSVEKKAGDEICMYSNRRHTGGINLVRVKNEKNKNKKR